MCRCQELRVYQFIIVEETRASETAASDSEISAPTHEATWQRDTRAEAGRGGEGREEAARGGEPVEKRQRRRRRLRLRLRKCSESTTR